MKARIRRASDEPSGPVDALDQEIKEDERVERQQRALKLRDLRVKTVELKREREGLEEQKRIEDLKKGTGQTAIAPVTMTPEMMTILAGMPEDQREKMMMTMMLMNSRGTDAMTMAMLWPVMGGVVKANPGMTQADLVKQSELLVNSLQTGWNMARQVQPAQSNQPSIIEMMNVMNNIISGTVEKRLETMVEKLQPGPSFFEQVLKDKELFDRAKTFFTGGVQGQQMTPELTVEIERIRGDNQISLNRMIMDDRWRMAEHNADIVTGHEKIQAIKEIITGPLGAVIQAMGTAGADVMRNVGGVPPGGPQQPASQPAAQGQQPPQPQPRFKPLPAVELVRCPVEGCGQDFYVSSGAIQFECPTCHSVLINSELAEAWQKEQEARISKQRAAAPARTQATPQAQAKPPQKGKKPGEPESEQTQQESAPAGNGSDQAGAKGQGDDDEESGVPYGTRPE